MRKHIEFCPFCLVSNCSATVGNAAKKFRQTTLEEPANDDEIDDLFTCDAPDDTQDPWEAASSNQNALKSTNQTFSELQYPDSEDELGMIVAKTSSTSEGLDKEPGRSALIKHTSALSGRNTTSAGEMDSENTAAYQRAEQRLMAVARKVSCVCLCTFDCIRRSCHFSLLAN